MLVTCRQMQEIEALAFESGLLATDLMETAGRGIARTVRQFFPHCGTLVLYLGTGNNAGDALVAGRELQKRGWNVFARHCGDPSRLKPLPLRHWQSLSGVIALDSPWVEQEDLARPLVLLDGLLGVGSQGALRPHLAALALEMNGLRRSHRAYTVAMDIPSGLDGDSGTPGENCVIADLTTTVAFAKKGLVADAAVGHVGRLALVPLPALTAFVSKESGDPQVITPQLLAPLLSRRPFDFHKGQAGRVGIMAGSRGFFGAAELCCHAALRAGAGLVTLLVKADAFDNLARRVPPEVMVKTVADYREALELRFDSLGIGPGLGFDREAEYLEVVQKSRVPTVVDADALTALARQKDGFLGDAPALRLLTPHPGEMARLMPNSPRMARQEQAETWATQHAPHTLLLKGARTVIATQGHPTQFNTTGHPGMATGGMGDVLTGVSAALLGQGHSPHNAAGIAAWMCGRAAELRACTQAEESTVPSDVIAHLGQAWAEI